MPFDNNNNKKKTCAKEKLVDHRACLRKKITRLAVVVCLPNKYFV